MTDCYIQLYNAVGDPVYLDLNAGIADWTLPSYVPLSSVKYLSHLTDENTVYYEKVATGEVTWSIPLSEISTEATKVLECIRSIGREETEEMLERSYVSSESKAQLLAIENYLENIGQIDECALNVSDLVNVNDDEDNSVCSDHAPTTTTDIERPNNGEDCNDAHCSREEGLNCDADEPTPALDYYADDNAEEFPPSSPQMHDNTQFQSDNEDANSDADSTGSRSDPTTNIIPGAVSNEQHVVAVSQKPAAAFKTVASMKKTLLKVYIFMRGSNHKRCYMITIM
jgi:hypothetical protein